MRGDPQTLFDRIRSRGSLDVGECEAIREAVARLPVDCAMTLRRDRAGHLCAMVEAHEGGTRRSTFLFLRGDDGIVIVVRRGDGRTSGGTVARIADAIDVMKFAVLAPERVEVAADPARRVH